MTATFMPRLERLFRLLQNSSCGAGGGGAGEAEEQLLLEALHLEGGATPSTF